jgi:hypothetical protein
MRGSGVRVTAALRRRVRATLGGPVAGFALVAVIYAGVWGVVYLTYLPARPATAERIKATLKPQAGITPSATLLLASTRLGRATLSIKNSDAQGPSLRKKGSP